MLYLRSLNTCIYTNSICIRVYITLCVYSYIHEYFFYTGFRIGNIFLLIFFTQVDRIVNHRSLGKGSGIDEWVLTRVNLEDRSVSDKSS